MTSSTISTWYIAGKLDGMAHGGILATAPTLHDIVHAANALLHTGKYAYIKIGKEYLT